MAARTSATLDTLSLTARKVLQENDGGRPELRVAGDVSGARLSNRAFQETGDALLGLAAPASTDTQADVGLRVESEWRSLLVLGLWFWIPLNLVQQGGQHRVGGGGWACHAKLREHKQAHPL